LKIAASLLAVLLVLVAPSVAAAQDQPSTGVPTQNIVPEPNSGTEPTEAGDRGGVLQLLLPALIVLALAGGGAHLVRQSRRARAQMT
jgi:hypothetical protein